MKRLILSTFVAGVLGASFFAPAAGQPGAHRPGVGATAKPAPTIDTFGDWTGAYAEHFGRGNASPTYGQVITVPDDETDLVRFRFYMRQITGTGHLILRGEVYAWNGTMATGTALWEGAPRRIALRSADGYRRVGFHVGAIELAAGADYVLFASVSKDYEETTPDYFLRWAVVPPDSYPGGTFTYLNDGGDESRWTTEQWGAVDIDAAFKAWLRPHL